MAFMRSRFARFGKPRDGLIECWDAIATRILQMSRQFSLTIETAATDQPNSRDGRARSMNLFNPYNISTADADWPPVLAGRLGEDTPAQIWLLGDARILNTSKTAIFCSSRCPGNAILNAFDAARELRDKSVTVISGYHSPVEKDCLRILLRGNQPIIYCVARGLNGMRIPKELRPAVEAGRLLILSPFEKTPRRQSIDSARRRNNLVAALADEVLIIHAEPGGEVERIQKLLNRWCVPIKSVGE